MIEAKQSSHHVHHQLSMYMDVLEHEHATT